MHYKGAGKQTIKEVTVWHFFTNRNFQV